MKNELTREQLKELYLSPSDDFVLIDVPMTKLFMIDGEGRPGSEQFQEAVRWLWTVVHPIKRAARERMGPKFVEPPLEGLWWADDPADFVAGNKDKFRWRMMVPTSHWVTEDMFTAAVSEAEGDHGIVPESLRLGYLDEGLCAQIMQVGPYESQAVELARRLHQDFLPANGLIPNGRHHEIYLTDRSRTAPERMKTVLRLPVRSQPDVVGGS